MNRNRIDRTLRNGTLFWTFCALSLPATLILMARQPQPGPAQTRAPVSQVSFHFARPADNGSEPPSANEQSPSEPSSTSSRDGKNLYLSQVLRKIERNKRYPLRELNDRIQDSVRVRLSISATGELSHASITTPSKYSAFNAEAVNCIRRSAPFPPFPSEMEQGSITLNLKIDFRLR
ncbi:MAG: hypothetical protein CMN76_02500 [Spirochaetaceae bacterium]|nr:hypothetical protein [Spirochaetaceae bacterium]